MTVSIGGFFSSLVVVVVAVQFANAANIHSAKKYFIGFISIFIALFDVSVNDYLVSLESLTSVNSASTVCDFGCSSVCLADSC